MTKCGRWILIESLFLLLINGQLGLAMEEKAASGGTSDSGIPQGIDNEKAILDLLRATNDPALIWDALAHPTTTTPTENYDVLDLADELKARGLVIDDLLTEFGMKERIIVQEMIEMGDPGVVEPLIKALGDEDRNVRRWAAEALGKIGDPGAVKPLKDLLKDKDPLVREAAAKALDRISKPKAAKPLEMESAKSKRKKVVKEPKLALQTKEIELKGTKSKTSLEVRNIGQAPLSWEILPCKGLFFTPSSGKLGAGQEIKVKISLNREEFNPGDYSLSFSIISDGGKEEATLSFAVFNEVKSEKGESLYLDFGHLATRSNYHKGMLFEIV